MAALIEARVAEDAAARAGLAEVIARCGVRTALVQDPVSPALRHWPPLPTRRGPGFWNKGCSLPLVDCPGDWTVEWHHIRTPRDHNGIMAGDRAVK